MDFGALPPEVNSGRMYLGPGPATLLAASAVWGSLAVELHAVAGGYQSVLSGLTEEWLGPTSMSTAAAVAPYVSWLTATAEQCQQAASQASAAAGAFETAYAMTVPPPLIAANRVRLLTLVATNFLGQNTPAVMATEAEYSEMWAQDTTAMYNYAASSASASSLTTFASPPRTPNQGGLAGSTAQKASAQMMSSMSQALRGLSIPGSSSGTGLAQTAVGGAASLGTSGATSPLGALSSLTSGLGGATSLADVHGLSLDFEGAGSMLAAEVIPGFETLGELGGSPPLGEGAEVHVGEADALGALAVPLSWADAVSSVTPLPTLDANVMPGGWGAMPSIGPAISGPGVSKLPLGRIGFRSSLIPRSPVAG